MEINSSSRSMATIRLSYCFPNREFGVNVVGIVRGERRIYIPQSDECIYPQDKLIVVGTDGQLQKFRSELDIRQDFPDEKNVRQEVTLHSFTVDEESPLLNKSIAPITSF